MVLILHKSQLADDGPNSCKNYTVWLIMMTSTKTLAQAKVTYSGLRFRLVTFTDIFIITTAIQISVMWLFDGIPIFPSPFDNNRLYDN